MQHLKVMKKKGLVILAYGLYTTTLHLLCALFLFFSGTDGDSSKTLEVGLSMLGHDKGILQTTELINSFCYLNPNRPSAAFF